MTMTPSISQQQPGDRMPDGTIYAGVSPETGKAMYTTPVDVLQLMQWKQAINYAHKLDAHVGSIAKIVVQTISMFYDFHGRPYL
jgi:hypothetical protein